MVGTELSGLEAALGHRFQDSELLERALTHSSCLPELGTGEADEGGASDTRQDRSGKAAEDRAGKEPEDNEKLEYLGDAVLGLLVSEYLVTSFPDWGEGQLSKSRARLVNASSLHAAARRLRLGEYLRLGRGEEKTGGREKPAMLADAYEAVVAAIYLDAGLGAARGFVQRSLLDEVVGEEAHWLGQPDDKSRLQELLQARGLPPAEYQVVRESGPDHRKTFVVEVCVAGRRLASATGVNKKEAEQAAAGRALAQLQSKVERGERENGGSGARR